MGDLKKPHHVSPSHPDPLYQLMMWVDETETPTTTFCHFDRVRSKVLLGRNHLLSYIVV